LEIPEGRGPKAKSNFEKNYKSKLGFPVELVSGRGECPKPNHILWRIWYSLEHIHDIFFFEKMQNIFPV